MRKTVLTIIGILAIVGIGCSSITIKNDYDKDADFREFKTYDWLDNRPGTRDEVRAAMQENEFFDLRLRRAVATELAAKGFVENQDDPDIIATYHVGHEDKVDVAEFGYRYGSGYWGGYGRAVDAYHYREGTLVLDLIDAKTMHMVWRGWAQRTIEEKTTPEESEKKINEAVQKMFNYYPPI